MVPLGMFKSSNIFTDHSKALLLLGFMFQVCLYYAVLSVHVSLVVINWERALVCDVFFVFCHFPIPCLWSGVVLDRIDS